VKRIAWLDGIAARIAAVSILGLVLAQLAAVGVALLLRPHELQVFQARWLVDTTSDVAREVFTRPPGERARALRERPEVAHLSFALQPTFESDAELRRPRGPGGRLQRGIAERLPPGYRVEVDLVAFAPGRAWNAPDRYIRRVPDEASVWNEGTGGVVPGSFVLAVRGPDGTWLVVRPKEAQIGWGWIVFAAWLAATAAAGAFAAWWAAHRLVRPLAALAREAARAGAGLAPLTQAAKDAPREVRTIGEALARMRGQLVRHVEDRTQLLAAVSHDLRTPLTRLRLRAEGIGDESERAKALGDLEEMERMIGETLAFARADALEAAPSVSILQPSCRRSWTSASTWTGRSTTKARRASSSKAARVPSNAHSPISSTTRSPMPAPRAYGSASRPTRSPSSSATTDPAFLPTGSKTCSAPSCGSKPRARAKPVVPAWGLRSRATSPARMAAT